MQKSDHISPEDTSVHASKAAVYEDKDTYVTKSVHIKDLSLLNDFLAELSQWKTCNHPNIQNLEDFKVAKKTDAEAEICYAVEKIPSSLEDVIKGRAKIQDYLTKEDYTIYCLQILSGLLYLDKRNAAHPNLKLSNVLISKEEEIKLTDLVNVKLYEDIASSSIAISPDLRGSKDKLDKIQLSRLSIWRLGMLFLELATLTNLEDLVINDETMKDVALRYDKKMAKMITQMIDDDPSRRYSLKKMFDDLRKTAKQLNIKDEKYMKESKKPKEEKKTEKKPRPQKTFTVMPESEVQQYYNDDGKFGDGKINKQVLKISTFNVNSLMNILTSTDKESNPLRNYLKSEDPDIFCVTETHLKYKDLNSSPINDFISPEYTVFHNCHKGDIGRSGVAVYTKFKPISVLYDLGIPEHDKEGRIITLEYEKFYFIGCYTPNSGRELQRLEYRTTVWDPDFRAFILNLAKKKNIILCGDLNVAHNKIDIHAPKRYAGFTDEERSEFTLLLKEGYVDAFRELYPKEVQYTFFSSHFDAREQHKGWRLDYFVLNKDLMKAVRDVKIKKEVLGSDHCPMEMIFDQSQI